MTSLPTSWTLRLERIAFDPTQPIAARIMAAKIALPFMSPKRAELAQHNNRSATDLVRRLQA
ncbi:MAG: hypothetical protein AAEC10_01220, partial [Rhodospirillales bacterium]